MIGRWRRESAPDGPAVALARDLMAETRAELGRADAKASTLLAGAMVALGIVGSALVGGQWSPLRMRPVPATLWGLAIVCALAGVACLLAVIYPRRRRSTGRHVLGYFDHVHAAGADALADALRARSRGPELEYLAAALAAVAEIAARKFALTRWAIRTLATAAVLGLAASIAAGMAR